MPRILFFVFIVFLVWLALRTVRRGARDDTAVEREETPAPVTHAVEPITQCAWCGVHVPSASAVALPDGRVYCSGEHRDRALAATTSPATRS